MLFTQQCTVYISSTYHRILNINLEKHKVLLFLSINCISKCIIKYQKTKNHNVFDPAHEPNSHTHDLYNNQQTAEMQHEKKCLVSYNKNSHF